MTQMDAERIMHFAGETLPHPAFRVTFFHLTE